LFPSLTVFPFFLFFCLTLLSSMCVIYKHGGFCSLAHICDIVSIWSKEISSMTSSTIYCRKPMNFFSPPLSSFLNLT
jgi:hypothetical protein